MIFVKISDLTAGMYIIFYNMFYNDIPVPRVFVALVYRTSRSSRNRYECHTEVPEVSGTGVNVLQNSQELFVGVNTPGMVCVYPTEPNLGCFLILLIPRKTEI